MPGPNTTEAGENNSVGELSGPLRPMMFAAQVEKLDVVDMWQARCPSVVATEASDKKTLIHRHGSR